MSVFLTLLGGILRFSSAFNGYLWMAPCASAVMVIRGLIFHLGVCSLWMRGLIYWDFLVWPCRGIYHGNR